MADWYVAKDADGSISRVIRIRNESGELRGEYLQDGAWVQDDVVLKVLSDDTWGSAVGAEEGERAARHLGAVD